MRLLRSPGKWRNKEFPLKKRPLVVGNWKLNGALEFNREIIKDLIASLRNFADIDFVICPPFVYLADIGRELHATNIAIGAQNVSDQSSGAFTGEVSAAMLAEIACEYVIIGHLERRTLYSEDQDMIVRKFEQVQNEKLTPIFCVGESLEQRDRDEQYDVIAVQLDSIRDIYQDTDFVVAYEPGWAIGTGRIADRAQISEMHDFIYRHLEGFLGKAVSGIRVIYGGSIDADNASDLFCIDNVDGGLVGGASLKSEAFALICQSACDSIVRG